MSRRLALITGATSGIGEACSELFSMNGYDLIITGRRKDRLDRLAERLKEAYQNDVLQLSFDVRELEEVKNALDSRSEEWKDIDVLINNAGLALGLDSIQEGSIEDWDRMIDTNVKGLLYVSRLILPEMINRGFGHVLNIGSTAGKDVYGRGGVYCATKHAVDALSRGMRIDLLGTGIKVTQISPGAAQTEFSEVRFKGDKQRADSVYDGYKPLSAMDIAEACLYSTNLPEHVCINDLVITAVAQADSHNIHRE